MTREQIEKRAQSGDHCFLYRTALQCEHIDWTCEVTHSGMWHCRAFPNADQSLFAYLTESLATALHHSDRVIATRAAFQAKGYLETLRVLQRLSPLVNVGGPAYFDAVRQAIQRVENWVRLTTLGN